MIKIKMKKQDYYNSTLNAYINYFTDIVINIVVVIVVPPTCYTTSQIGFALIIIDSKLLFCDIKL